jgi:prephenate dehydrogenase
MKVAIIGGTGRMGRWFARYFTANDYDVGIFARHRKEAEQFAETIGAKADGSMEDSCRGSKLVIVSVPISETSKVVEKIEPFLADDAVLMEIASIKGGVIDSLRGVRKAIPLCVHPLFGPGASVKAANRYALIPVRDKTREKRAFKQFFPKSESIIISAEEHDAAMAKVLSLTHLMNALFLKTLSDGMSDLSKLSGTTFRIQLALAMGIMHDEPTQLASLQVRNSHFKGVLEELLRNAQEWQGLIIKGKQKELSAEYDKIKRAIEKESSYRSSYEKMYAMFRSLQRDD